MPSILTPHLLVLLSSLAESRLDSLKDLVQANRMALLLYRLDKELFPFYDERSPLYLGSNNSHSRKEAQSFEEHRLENRAHWQRIISLLSKIEVEDWRSSLDEFQQDQLEAFLNLNEVAVEYFFIIFIYFLSKAAPLTFKRLQIKYPEAVSAVMQTWEEQNSGKKNRGNSSFHLQQSPQQILNHMKKKDYLVTDKSIQDLVKFISELQNEASVIREELVFKEKETFELHDKVNALRLEKKNLKEDLEQQYANVQRLNFRLESYQRGIDESPESPTKASLEIANLKIEDLYTEIDHLQRKNADLEHKIHNLNLSKHAPGLRDSGDSDSDRFKERIRCLQIENKLLEGKVVVLENNANMLSDKLLKEKENSSRLSDQILEVHKVLTQKEISLKAALNDREAMAKDNERLRDTLIEKDQQLKRLEIEFNTIVKKGENMRFSAKSMGLSDPTEDSNLELIKICKEVNRNYLKELNCVYGLLHDTFVSELTGTTLAELIKKRLEEEQRPNGLLPQ
jgi:hypothetical protein